MARIGINTRNHTKEKPYLIIRIFSKLVRQKNTKKSKQKTKNKNKNQQSIELANYMYVCE